MSRPVGFAVGAIPISEISAYCDLIGVTDLRSRHRLARFVMAMDRAERQHHGDTQGKG